METTNMVLKILVTVNQDKIVELIILPILIAKPNMLKEISIIRLTISQ